MAAKIVLGLHHGSSSSVSPLGRHHIRACKSGPVFEVDQIENEYGEELHNAKEEAKQWLRSRSQSLDKQDSSSPMQRYRSGKSNASMADVLSRSKSRGGFPAGLNDEDVVQTPFEASSGRPSSPSAGPQHKARLNRTGTRHHLVAEPPWFVLDPHNRHKVHWDVLIALMIIYSVLVIPWRIGFSQEATGGALVLEVVIDSFFVLDILLTFLTGFYDDREVFCGSLKAIAWRYLMSFLVIDVVSVMPVDYFVGTASDGGNDTSAKIPKMLRMLRLLKLGRLFRLKRLTEILEETVSINMQWINMFKVIFQVVFLIHMLACLCYWLATPACPDDRPEEPCDLLEPVDRPWSTWVRMFHVDRINVMSRYLASFHLVTATVMAVGYGDIFPTNVEERIFSVVTQLIGAIVFGFILSAVTTLIESASPRDIESKCRMNQLKEWLTGRDVPSGLRQRIWSHFTYVGSQKSIFKDEVQILENLPTCLRIRLVQQMRHECIKRLVHIFPNEDACLITEVVMLLRPSQCSINECIIEAGEPPLDLFFVKTGCIEAVLDDDDPMASEDVEFIMAENMQVAGSAAHAAWSTKEESRSRAIDAERNSRLRESEAQWRSDRTSEAFGSPDPPSSTPPARAIGRQRNSPDPPPPMLPPLVGGFARNEPYEPPEAVTSTVGPGGRLRAPSPPATLHLPGADDEGHPRLNRLQPQRSAEALDPRITATGVAASGKDKFIPEGKLFGGVGTGHSRRHSADVALRLSHVRHGVDPSCSLPSSVLCALYLEGEAFGEFPVSPVRLQGGESRSEILALCKDELQGVLMQFTGAADRYAEYQRQAMRALWEAVMSEEWASPLSLDRLGPRRRRLKSRLLYNGRATPVNEISPEAFQSSGESTASPQEIIFSTRRLDTKTGRVETRNETEKNLLARWVIPPNNYYKIRWDFFLGALIFYSVLIIPYRFGFSVDPDAASRATDVVVDLFFFADMIANFRCGFLDNDGAINTLWVDIRKNYLRGWFVIDFLSTFPIDWVLEALVPNGGNNSRAVKLIRFARLFRLLKLARVFKLSRLMSLANSFVEIPPLVIRMFSLCLKICFMAHIVGCLWFYITTVSISSDECDSGKLKCEYNQPSSNWHAELGEGNDVDTNMTKYIVTLYWVFTTMTTVGYGDITPSNDLERAYAVVVMIFGATVFGYIIGSIAELSSGREDALSSKLCVLREFCDERGLNQKTQGFVQRHYAFWYQEMTPLHDEPRLLHELPPSLRKEVILFIHRQTIRDIALFKRPLPDWFVATTVRLLEPQAFAPGSDIIGPDEAGMYQDIIFLQEGVAEAYRPATSPASKHNHDYFANLRGMQNRLLNRKRRKRMKADAEEEEDEEDESSDDEDILVDEVIEIIQKGMVWGFDPLLHKTVEGQAPKQLVCLRCCQDEPCFVFTLRHGMLSDIFAMQMDYGCMVQEVLSDTILRQAMNLSRHRPSSDKPSIISRLGLSSPRPSPRADASSGRPEPHPEPLISIGGHEVPARIGSSPVETPRRVGASPRPASLPPEPQMHPFAPVASIESMMTGTRPSQGAVQQDFGAWSSGGAVSSYDGGGGSGSAESPATLGLRAAAATSPDDDSRGAPLEPGFTSAQSGAWDRARNRDRQESGSLPNLVLRDCSPQPGDSLSDQGFSPPGVPVRPPPLIDEVAEADADVGMMGSTGSTRTPEETPQGVTMRHFLAIPETSVLNPNSPNDEVRTDVALEEQLILR